MKIKAHSIVLVASLLGLYSCGNASDTPLSTPTSGNTNISVDESYQPIIESQVNTFEGIYERADIDAAYKPEGEVVKDLLNDSTRIAIISRELTADEVATIKQNQRIPRSTKIAIDAVALITNPNNPDSLLTLDEVKDIFSGRVKDWSELERSTGSGEITIVFDNNNSSTARYVRDSLTTDQKLPQNTFAANSHQALIDYVAQNENALGVIGVNWISDLDDTTAVSFLNRIKVVGISEDPAPLTTGSFYQPYQAYIAQQAYPLRRNLYIISTEGRTGLGTGFASFLGGDQGQRMILKSGLVPATMPVRVIGLRNQ
ncbi:PstS family phosphate ABC transporter substrate-binding protein [Pontibacter pamirensis]|uniref:PstS family phosphate ABC transporter substrate-binding protein n=1 Tax=Pontibacter pamirensis TaxID=2562824 RepID=UPI00138963EB|nr:substrate-binding domain-containing protein [Pontibacter pamirensis]